MTRAAELDPRLQGDLFNLAETYWLLRDYPRAAKLLDDVIALAPDWAAALRVKVRRFSSPRASRLRRRGRPLHTAADRIGFPTLARAVIQNLNVIEPTFLVSADPAFRRDIEALALPGLPDSVGYYRLKSEVYRYAGRPELERVYLDSARAVLEVEGAGAPGRGRFSR